MSAPHPVLAAADLTGRPVRADSEAAFLDAYGHLFEHSPWVVERAWAKRPFADAKALHQAFLEVLDEAGEAERLSLVRAHPELADKTAMAEGLTEDSAREQSGAGLDRLTPQEYAAFHDLNNAYRAAHAIPFIICVRLQDKASILAAMRARLANPPQAELAEALRQVGLIAQLRLADATGASRP